MSNYTDDELKEIEELTKKASGESWAHISSGPCFHIVDFGDSAGSTGFLLPADADFIAASREAVPRLVRELREARAELQAMKMKVMVGETLESVARLEAAKKVSQQTMDMRVDI